MSRVPRPSSGIDLKSLPLTPAQGFVFSRVDGTASEKEIATQTGLPAESVTRAIDRLIELGAVFVGDDVKAARQREASAVSHAAFGGVMRAGAPAHYDEKELEQPADIPVDRKKQILNAFAVLNTLNYYELLGLHELVDKKQIKSAYYQVAPEFHPDKFFRKELGVFKAKIEAIFARLTEAHDTLTSKQRRAEYDEYLSDRARSNLLESTEGQIAQARAEAEREANRAVGAATLRPGAPTSSIPPPLDPRLQAIRRQTFAAKLRGGLSPGNRASTPPPARMDPRDAAEALRARYEAALQVAKKHQIAKYVDVARHALDAKDWAAAANAYRIAASLAPDDPEIQAASAEVAQTASRMLADTFMKQGEYEANQERWEEAAISFGKVCKGRPEDAKAHERAAHAMYKAAQTPRTAVELARKAVELAPKQPVYRITLAHCYRAAGFQSSADAELVRAVEVSAEDKDVSEKIAKLVKQAKEQWANPSKPAPRLSSPVPAPPSSAGRQGGGGGAG
jgi:curved DNA-binding protein CbpA